MKPPADTVDDGSAGSSGVSSSDDAAVIEAVLDGDLDRYAELVDRYQEMALKLAFSLLGNYEDAKEVSQEAFVSAYRSLGRFRGGAQFSTWLYRIVLNECRDEHRRRARRPAISGRIGGADSDEGEAGLFIDIADPAGDPSDRLAERELARSLVDAVGALPIQQREAFLLHHVHGLPLEEVAGVMGCRVGTVKSHIFRATERVRRQLAPWIIDLRTSDGPVG